MKHLYDVHMFKGPNFQLSQEEADRLRQLLALPSPPKFVELRGQPVATSNIAQMERGDPEPASQLAAPDEPDMSEDERARNLERYQKMKVKKLAARREVSRDKIKEAEAELEELRKRKAEAT